jgi:hypothetical protein
VPEPNPFAQHAPSFRPRPYQQAALSRFSARVAEGRRRFYLVSPPGSGKTLLGLAMAVELGAPVSSLSPTTTIAQQWVSRLAEHWVCLDGPGAPLRAATEPGGKAATDERAFPVPRRFGNHTAAEQLLAIWRAHRDPDARLVHTRTDEGAALVRRLRGRPAMPGQVRLGRVWA